MSGNNLLLDTNVILYFLNGDKTLLQLFEQNSLFTSIITEIELLSYPDLSDEEIGHIQLFLDQCTLIALTDNVKQKTIELRKKYGLLTADKDFKDIESANVIFYSNQ